MYSLSPSVTTGWPAILRHLLSMTQLPPRALCYQRPIQWPCSIFSCLLWHWLMAISRASSENNSTAILKPPSKYNSYDSISPVSLDTWTINVQSLPHSHKQRGILRCHPSITLPAKKEFCVSGDLNNKFNIIFWRRILLTWRAFPGRPEWSFQDHLSSITLLTFRALFS